MCVSSESLCQGDSQRLATLCPYGVRPVPGVVVVWGHVTSCPTCWFPTSKHYITHVPLVPWRSAGSKTETRFKSLVPGLACPQVQIRFSLIVTTHAQGSETQRAESLSSPRYLVWTGAH